MKKTSWLVLLMIGGVVAAAWWRFHIPSETQNVVVYVSHDEVFSEPILKDFEKETPNLAARATPIYGSSCMRRASFARGDDLPSSCPPA